MTSASPASSKAGRRARGPSRALRYTGGRAVATDAAGAGAHNATVDAVLHNVTELRPRERAPSRGVRRENAQSADRLRLARELHDEDRQALMCCWGFPPAYGGPALRTH